MASYREFNLKIDYASGTAADNNITVTGIKTGDVIIAVFELQNTATSGDACISAERTSNCSIVGTNLITCDTGTVNKELLIFWHDATV